MNHLLSAVCTVLVLLVFRVLYVRWCLHRKYKFNPWKVQKYYPGGVSAYIDIHLTKEDNKIYVRQGVYMVIMMFFFIIDMLRMVIMIS